MEEVRTPRPGFIIGLCILVLAVGALSAGALVRLKKPPAHATTEERAVRVDVRKVTFEDAGVTMTGYGEARARDQVAIAPEIAGRIVAIHPRLDAGEVIPAGELLFAIDPREYETRAAEAGASVEQFEAALQRIKRQFEIDKTRLETFRRTRELAKADLDRAQDLYAKDAIESKSFVDNKEIAYNNADDAYDRLVQTLDLYPILIRESRSNLAAAQAAYDRVQIDLERTLVAAPFDARIVEVNLEADQYVTPGAEVLTLADDSVIEIPVSLNSREARMWLLFEDEAQIDNKAWFNKLTQVPVEVAWTESLNENRWTGTLVRVERFDKQTRTLIVVVRVDGDVAQHPDTGNLPLVDGMFCRARIPGKVTRHVAKLPAESVGFDRDASGYRTVYIARKDTESGHYRLESRDVRESHIDGDSIFIADGLHDGELVITTRLINPLENTLLDIAEPLPVETD